jgi:hypothetical protein
MKIPLRHAVAELGRSRRDARASDDARRLGARSARRHRILRLLARLAPPTARPTAMRPDFGAGADGHSGESTPALPAPKPSAHRAPRRNLGRAWATRMITGSAAGRRPLSPGLWI